ncbi:MAG: hypothetical protein RR537_03870 [Longicatena sp.]
MEISNERLNIIGRLIGIYREERRNNTQNNYTQKRFCKDICSINTLKNIELGNSARSKDVYVLLLTKFDLALGEVPIVDNAMKTLLVTLYDTMEYADLEKIDIICGKALRLIESVKDYVYYAELYDVFNDIKKFYQKGVFISNKKMLHYRKVIHVLPNMFADLLRILVYTKAKIENVEDIETLRDLVEPIRLHECNHKWLELHLFNYYYRQKKFFSMYILGEELEAYFIKHSNWIRLVDIYEGEIMLFGTICFDKSMEFIQKALLLVDEEKIVDYTVRKLYATIASLYYYHHDYISALKYFDKMMQYKGNTYLEKYILMADCQNRLHQRCTLPLIPEETYNSYPSQVTLMYNYFTFTENIPVFIKENYILTKILPTLCSQPFIDIFRFELFRLINTTGHYKLLHTFERLTEGVK